MSKFWDLLTGKAPAPAAPKASKATGFFSTDVLPGQLAQAGTFRQDVLAKSFQPRALPKMMLSKDSKNLPTIDKIIGGASNLSVGVPDAQFGFYAGQGFIGYQACAMISQNWLVDKCITMPADDAVRNGFEITINSGQDVPPEAIEYMRMLDAKFNLTGSMREFVRMGRMFGVRVAMFKVETDNPAKYYKQPFNPDGVKPGSYKGIVQIDPYWMVPMLDSAGSADPASMHFYEPTYWQVNGLQIHRSHLVIYIPSPVADILKPTYYFGGISIPQKVAERAYGAERLANEGPLLALTKRSTVIHVDLTEALANEVSFTERIMKWAEYLSNFGIKIAGTEEQVEQFDTSLNDVDVVTMTQFQLVAAAAGVPATKLLGTQPKGFNSTGDYEMKSYHEMLESTQSNALTPLVERHHLLCMRSFVEPKFGKGFATGIEWQPLDVPTAKEQADTNLVLAQTDGALVTAGAISPEEARQRIINDPTSGYNGLPAAAPEEEDDLDDGDTGNEEEAPEDATDAKPKKPVAKKQKRTK